MSKALKIVLVFACTYLAAFIAWSYLAPGVQDWYAELGKPRASIPAWFYFVAFLITYCCAAIGACFVWLKDKQTAHETSWMRFYLFHLIFSGGWVMFFFGYHAIFVSMIDIVFCAFVLMLLLMTAWHIDRRAAYFLMPYFVWMLVVAVENGVIWYWNW